MMITLTNQEKIGYAEHIQLLVKQINNLSPIKNYFQLREVSYGFHTKSDIFYIDFPYNPTVQEVNDLTRNKESVYFNLDRKVSDAFTNKKNAGCECGYLLYEYEFDTLTNSIIIYDIKTNISDSDMTAKEQENYLFVIHFCTFLTYGVDVNKVSIVRKEEKKGDKIQLFYLNQEFSPNDDDRDKDQNIQLKKRLLLPNIKKQVITCAFVNQGSPFQLDFETQAETIYETIFNLIHFSFNNPIRNYFQKIADNLEKKEVSVNALLGIGHVFKHRVNPVIKRLLDATNKKEEDLVEKIKQAIFILNSLSNIGNLLDVLGRSIKIGQSEFKFGNPKGAWLQDLSNNDDYHFVFEKDGEVCIDLQELISEIVDKFFKNEDYKLELKFDLKDEDRYLIPYIELSDTSIRLPNYKFFFELFFEFMQNARAANEHEEGLKLKIYSSNGWIIMKNLIIVGDDMAGENLKKKLEQAGISTEKYKKIPPSNSGGLGIMSSFLEATQIGEFECKAKIDNLKAPIFCLRIRFKNIKHITL